MSIATTELSRSAQHLIDSRLDTIDRMLLGRVSRQERLEIVREVEAQVFEQLHERGGEDPSREDVLAVLARLDPPEAYLPEEERPGEPQRPRMVPSPRAGFPSRAPGKDRAIARAGGIVALFALALMILGIPALYMLGAFMSSEIVILAGGGGVMVLALAGSVVAIGLAAYSRMSSAWAIVGLVAGILTLLVIFGIVGLVIALL